jgi:hypothetical protein
LETSSNSDTRFWWWKIRVIEMIHTPEKDVNQVQSWRYFLLFSEWKGFENYHFEWEILEQKVGARRFLEKYRTFGLECEIESSNIFVLVEEIKKVGAPRKYSFFWGSWQSMIRVKMRKSCSILRAIIWYINGN